VVAFALDRQFRGVERVPWQQQLALEFGSPTGLDEVQIKLFVRSVNFIAHNRAANRSEMHANLVSPSSMRNRPNQSEFVVIGRSGFNESSFEIKLIQRRTILWKNGFFSLYIIFSNLIYLFY